VDNFKMDLGETDWPGGGGIDRISLSQDGDKWRALVAAQLVVSRLVLISIEIVSCLVSTTHENRNGKLLNMPRNLTSFKFSLYHIIFIRVAEIEMSVSWFDYFYLLFLLLRSIYCKIS
jgi:hypothetical protein